jgi:ATP-binding cassette subfamily B protein
VALAGLFLVLAAAATLAFPVALRLLIDGGLMPADRNDQVMALRGHFGLLFGVAVALGVFSAARFFVVSWLGERVTTDVRNAVYTHVLHMSPEFFETTQTGEVLSRLTADTTLVQTVVGSSLSMGLRNAVMGLGALGMLVYSHPYVMLQVLAVVGGVVLPAMWFGRRVRGLSRDSQDRVADASAIAAEVLNAMPTVQSYTAEPRESARFQQAGEQAFDTAIRRSRARAGLVAFIIIANSALILWGMYQGTQAVLAGKISAGQLGQAGLYVAIFAGAVAVLGEVYGDLLRAAGASERLMELLSARSPVQAPASPVTVPLPAQGSTVNFEDVEFAYPSRLTQPALSSFNLTVSAGQTVALVGGKRCRQNHRVRPVAAFLRPHPWPYRCGWHPRCRHGATWAARPHGVGATGSGDFLRQCDGEHPLRPARCQRRRGSRRRPCRVCRRVHFPSARGLPDVFGRTRCAFVGGTTPANCHCTRHAQKPTLAIA